MTNLNFIKLAAPLALVVVALSACGGGGGGGQTYNTPQSGAGTPAMAQAYDGFIAYVQRLVGSNSETSEPDNVAALDPAPTAENTEPVKTQ